MGKLIVFEGTDGSGKSTQFSLLTRRLEARGVDFRTMVFPQYTEPSSALIRMYLGGEFGARPSDVNAYTASTFYAVDRFAAFRKVWGEYYRNGGLMLSDRYTTSNAVHQASKEPEQDREKFFAWLYDLEYRHMGLPVPDLTRRTAIGALGYYISDPSVKEFQPMNINFGIIPPLDHFVKGKRNKNAEISQRALEILEMKKADILA